MKKILAIVLLVFVTSACFAQQAEALGTEFDIVMLRKGTLTVKEFIPIGMFDNKIDGQIAILTDVQANMKVYALRLTMSYYNSQYDHGDAVCVFDAKELESALNSLDYMISKNSETTSDAPYTEVVYRSDSDAEFGFYISGKQRKMYFKVSSKATMFDDTSKLYDLRSFFEKAKQKIVEMGGSA